MASFTYDLAAQRYRGPNGAFVSEAVIRQAVDAVIAGTREQMRATSERLLSGAISLADWQQQQATTLKALHVATATAAHGGTAAMSQADYGYVGAKIKDQYAYLNTFAADVASGRQPLNGRLLARTDLYAEAARLTYGEMGRRDRRLRGSTEERRRLTAQESCAGCTSAAAEGWQPAGELPALGTLECGSRCRCSWQTRTARTEAA